MRCREFLMKDAYSFDPDKKGMEQSYHVMYDAYCRVFDRLGLDYVAVEADSGAIGGSVSHEFHVLADSGEDGIGINTKVGYASNIELVPLPPSNATRNAPVQQIQAVDTPGVRTIQQLCDYLNVSADNTLKTLLVQGESQPIAMVVRGDHELNLLKAEKVNGVAQPVQFLSSADVSNIVGVEIGSIGPVNLASISGDTKLRVVADFSTQPMSDFVCGANGSEKHYVGANWERDVTGVEFADLRKAVDGDPCPDEPQETLTVKRGIEVGHVFQLGTKYSEAFDATCIDADGQNAIMWMGCYGIGVSRIVAAAIEQNHDDDGIIWPDPIAPFSVCIVPINYQQSENVAKCSDDIHDRLINAGVEVLLDDRDDRAGVKFADMDLLGIPHRVVVSDRNIANGEIEYKHRADNQAIHLSIDSVENEILKRIQSS